MRRIFLSAAFLLSGTVWAHTPREGDIRGSIGPFWYKTDRRDHSFDSSTQGGLGVVAEGDVDYHGGIEIGVFYIRQLFSIQKDSKELSEFGKRIYITTGYRHWFVPEFSAAAAFFSSYAMGDPQVVRNDFGINAQPKSSASDVTEYGFDFSLQYEPLHKDRLSLVVDARYSLSVTPKPGEASNFFGLFVAFKYFIQGQQPGED